MTKRYLKERQERLQALAAADALKRCAFCKRPLSAQALQAHARFCNSDCLQDAEERDALVKG